MAQTLYGGRISPPFGLGGVVTAVTAAVLHETDTETVATAVGPLFNALTYVQAPWVVVFLNLFIAATGNTDNANAGRLRVQAVYSDGSVEDLYNKEDPLIGVHLVQDQSNWYVMTAGSTTIYPARSVTDEPNSRYHPMAGRRPAHNTPGVQYTDQFPVSTTKTLARVRFYWQPGGIR